MAAKNKRSGGNSLHQRILEIFQQNPNQRFNYKQVAKKMRVGQASKKKIIDHYIRELVAEDVLVEDRPGKYMLRHAGNSNQTLIGKVDMTQGGNAYVVVEGMPEDIYVDENNLGTALHGDLVEINVIKVKRNGKPIGAVQSIVKRGQTDFVGRIEKSLKYAFLVPDNRRMQIDFFIPLSKLKGASTGDKAIVRMVKWDEKDDSPEAEVIQVLGPEGENETEMHAILAEYNLPAHFPKHIEEEAAKLDLAIHSSEVKNRRDMRKVTTFTIDPDDAKDFDDALSIQKLKNGNWEIGVHIADVSHYLQEGTELDEEAYSRATSVYLVDRVVPMLPEVLSNFACSLRPNEDKYTFSAIFELDEEANILDQWFGRTVIHSDHRFTYDQAQELIDGGEGKLKDEVVLFDQLAKKLRAARFKKGAIDFHSLEVKFRLDEKGEPEGVFIKEQKDANRLIEEFMLLANKKVAEFIGKNKNETAKPFVYRVHDNPDPEKLQTFSTFIRKFGYRIDLSSPKGVSSTLNRLMKDVSGKAEEQLISTLAIRTMAKAEYSTDNVGHYGLAFPFYTHFTSPIRRYPDVMVHRLLQHYLDGGKAANQEELEEKCKHSSEMEKLASDAERDSIKFMQVKFMQGKEGEVFGGVISGVSDFGIFVELEGNKCEGLVRMKSLTDDFYHFDPDNYSVQGRRTGKIYRMGDEVTVRVKRADLSKKQLDFEMLNDFDLD